MPGVFPIEIYQLIFRNVKDAATLLSCQLACRALRTVAWEATHHFVILSRPRQMTKFLLHALRHPDEAKLVRELEFNM